MTQASFGDSSRTDRDVLKMKQDNPCEEQNTVLAPDRGSGALISGWGVEGLGIRKLAFPSGQMGELGRVIFPFGVGNDPCIAGFLEVSVVTTGRVCKPSCAPLSVRAGQLRPWLPQPAPGPLHTLPVCLVAQQMPLNELTCAFTPTPTPHPQICCRPPHGGCGRNTFLAQGPMVGVNHISQGLSVHGFSSVAL